MLPHLCNKFKYAFSLKALFQANYWNKGSQSLDWELQCSAQIYKLSVLYYACRATVSCVMLLYMANSVGSENNIKQSVQPVKLSHLDIALYVCIPETNVYVSTPVCRGWVYGIPTYWVDQRRILPQARWLDSNCQSSCLWHNNLLCPSLLTCP